MHNSDTSVIGMFCVSCEVLLYVWMYEKCACDCVKPDSNGSLTQFKSSLHNKNVFFVLIPTTIFSIM